AMTVFDDGGGPRLYAGGDFTSAGGVQVNGIARWDRATWTSLGSGLSSPPNYGPRARSLIVYDDGGGPALYVSGEFTGAGGAPALGFARWDGASWSAPDDGTSAQALAVYDDGGGPALYAGGYFTSVGDVTALCIAKWDGTTWT